MEDEKSFLADIAKEGETPFETIDEQVKDTPAESPEEKEPEKETPSPTEDKKEDEKELPFHEHPRWKRMADENKLLREEVSQFKEQLDEYGDKIIERDSTTTIPKWFSVLYGENLEAYEAYQEHTKEERNAIKTEIIREQEESRRLEEDKRKHWNDWISDSVKELKDEGATFDENELIKTALDYMPSDEHGNVSLRKALKILQGMKAPQETAKTQVKKDIADISSGKAATVAKKDYMTSHDLRGKSFNTLAEED